MRNPRHIQSISAGLCLSLAFSGVLFFARPVETFGDTTLKTSSASSPLPTAGWLQKGSQWQYALSDGSLIRGGWIKDGEGWYYFDTDGIMASDTVLDIEGHTYTFERSGAWLESPPTDPLFVHLPAGRYENSVYEHAWADIRLTLPDYTIVQTAKELNTLSAHDYIPSYYDFLAITPAQSLFGVVIQYNSDLLEEILADDHDVFSSFWGKYDLSPTAPSPVTIAGRTYQKIGCRLPGNMKMNIYLRNQDHKVVYLFTIFADGKAADAENLITSITGCIM